MALMAGIDLGNDVPHIPDESPNRDEAEYIGGIIKRVSNFSMASLEDRKKFQKTIYLLQAFGIDLGYEFIWYLHGPYSPELTRVGYAIEEITISAQSIDI